MTSFIPWYIFDGFRLIQSKVSGFKSKLYLFLDTHLVISLYSLSEVVCLISSFYHYTLWSSHQRPLFDPIESMWRRPKSKTFLFLNTHLVILITIWWSPLALSLLFVTSPCESRDEILFKGGSSVTLQNILDCEYLLECVHPSLGFSENFPDFSWNYSHFPVS